MTADGGGGATVADLHRIAWRERNRFPPDSLLNCGAYSTRLREVLRDRGVPAAVWVGEVTRDARRRPFGEEHAWVRVPERAVADADGAVVLDGTLDQFCRANRDEGRVHVALGPREDLPTVACLVVGRDDRYDRWYTGGRPERADGGGPHP